MARKMRLSFSVTDVQNEQSSRDNSVPLQYIPGRPTKMQIGIWKKSAILRRTDISGEYNPVSQEYTACFDMPKRAPNSVWVKPFFLR